MAALTAILGIILFLAFLAWRGLKTGATGDQPSDLVWREAGEADLF